MLRTQAVDQKRSHVHVDIEATLNSSKHTQPKTLHLNFHLEKVLSQQIFKNPLESLRGERYIKRTEEFIC